MGNRPVRVKWVNDLYNAGGNYMPQLLTVDPTLHWANFRCNYSFISTKEDEYEKEEA
jgi:hypothetical protein